MQGGEQPVDAVMLVLTEVPRLGVADALHTEKKEGSLLTGEARLPHY